MPRPWILLISFALFALASLALVLRYDTQETHSFNAGNENDSIGSLPTTSELKSSPPNSPIVIPFRLTKDNNLVVQARLNESESLDLMFHTAFEGLALTEEAVKKLPNLGGVNRSKSKVGVALQSLK